MRSLDGRLFSDNQGRADAPRVTEIPDASTGRGGLWLSFADFESATGWERKPQGVCLGVPIPPGKQWINERAGQINLAAFAEHLGQPAVADAANGVWAFGPARYSSSIVRSNSPIPFIPVGPRRVQ